MMIELYRIKNNHIGLFSVMVCILMGILGLILLVSLDGYKLDEISIGLLQYSIYTVYTQFGFFVLPVLSIYLITIDYKEKNITFYKLLKYNEHLYFLQKLAVLLILNTIGNFIVSFSVSVLYRNFSDFILFFLKLENVSVFITFISLLYAFVFKNLMISYCVNFAIWVTGIVLYSINDSFKIFCFYDASLEKHSAFQDVLEAGAIMHSSVITEILYNAVVFLIGMVIVTIFRKRWMKNGI
ncbi:MAG: hypothetical protein HFH74_04850 [Lachnospiraceae bacterium]|jgi:hypothetical protein|nr:hypothetical protein [Lachnospiraceae bacterium]